MPGVDARVALEDRRPRHAAPVGRRRRARSRGVAPRRVSSAIRQRRGSASTSSNSPGTRRLIAACTVSASWSGARMHSSQLTSSKRSSSRTRNVFGSASTSRRSAAVGPQDPADLVDRPRHRVGVHDQAAGRDDGALHLALAEARQRDGVEAAEAAAHDRHDLLGRGGQVHAVRAADPALVAQDHPVRLRPERRAAATRARARTPGGRRRPGTPPRSARPTSG